MSAPTFLSAIVLSASRTVCSGETVHTSSPLYASISSTFVTKISSLPAWLTTCLCFPLHISREITLRVALRKPSGPWLTFIVKKKQDEEKTGREETKRHEDR